MTEDVIDSGGRVVLTGISSRAFEHPADRTALTALRQLTGFDQLIKAASGMLRERQYRLAYLASAVRVDERQFATVHSAFADALTVLDVPERPELYVSANPVPQATTLGVDRPFISLSSAMVDLMDVDELRFVLGHELGHVMSGHALYRTLLQHLMNLAALVGWIPIGGLGLRAVIAALREWERKSELSADRAGLLAGQDVEASRRVHMKLAGGARLGEMDGDAFLEQASEYESAGTLRDGILKLLNTERSSHPFTAVRALELRRWATDGGYEQVLAGDYPRREDDGNARFSDDARDAARGYKERFENSGDQLVGALRQVGDTVGQAAGGLSGWLRNLGTPPAGQQPGTEQPGSQQSGAGQPGAGQPAGESEPDAGESDGDDPFGSGTE
ncbi:MAG TPA: M48 family metallopeptidase [Mycobacteriales bacterium]|nr:M48 family metallopeptidase [Mycobacteriales bacterium]